MSLMTLEISPSGLVSNPKCLIQITLTHHIILQCELHLSLHLHTHLQLPLAFSHGQTLENQKLHKDLMEQCMKKVDEQLIF